LFEFHLQIAKEFDFPVIVHTPRRNKKEITEKTIELLLKNKIEKGVLDHIDEQNLKSAKNISLNLGLTVQMGKLTPENFYKIVNENEHEMDSFVLNTDIGRDEADLYAAYKAINILKNKGINENLIDLIASGNAKKLFKI
ncbi:MAG: TatD family hydrolase, partial [Candidatus Hodarchaeota archaeon]